jgi:lysozyme
MVNITRYREAAITYLKSKATFLYFEIDDLLDKALRMTSDLPLRPLQDDTYNNIVGIKPVVEQRLVCLKLLLERLNKNNGDNSSLSDYLIDDAVRLLNSLPKRPSNNLPYVALFNLEEKRTSQTKEYNPASFYKTNKAGIDLMHSFEGLVLKAYKDPGSADGNPISIGYGTTRIKGKPIKLGTEITVEQANEYFRNDLIQFEDAVKKYVKVSITENQFSACVCFTYNVGVGAFISSTFLKRINNKDFIGASEAITWFNKGGSGKILAGLVKRRESEAKLFLS